LAKPARKYSQAARLHNVIRILESRYGASIEELAEECAVTRRTIYRDLQEVAAAGFPLLKEAAADGGAIYRFLTGFRKIPPITFSLPELMTLYLCRGQLGFLRGTPFEDDLQAIFERIRSSLPPRSVAHLERLAEAVTPRFQGVRDYRDKREILQRLREALLLQKSCSMRYAPPQRPVQDYFFDPYTLLFFKNSLYLGGYAHNRRGLRLFLVDRILELEVTGQRFNVPDDFTVEQLTGDAFGLVNEGSMEVQVRFAAEIAHLIRERSWHPGQALQEEEGGDVLLTFTASGEKEILAWLYSYLPHVEVLAPTTLRRAFYQGLRSCLKSSDIF
jgi:predicted DNA-binding transcriptional regulator YafY